jgi:hypothetical protein
LRSKFLTFFRENPVLLLVPAMLVLIWFFTDPIHRIELGEDLESRFSERGEFSFRFDEYRVRVLANGNWNVTAQAVVEAQYHVPYIREMPKRGEGTWRIRGEELILGDQAMQMGRPFDFGGSRLSDDGDALQLVLPNGRVHLVAPLQ